MGAGVVADTDEPNLLEAAADAGDLGLSHWSCMNQSRTLPSFRLMLSPSTLILSSSLSRLILPPSNEDISRSRRFFMLVLLTVPPAEAILISEAALA